MTKLLDCELEFIKFYNHKNNNAKYNVGQTVKINHSLLYNRGYAGQLGVVIKNLYIDMDGFWNYYYVLAYDNKTKRYCVCGFTEIDLDAAYEFDRKLWDEFKTYIKCNEIKFMTKEQRSQFERFKNNYIQPVLSQNLDAIDNIDYEKMWNDLKVKLEMMEKHYQNSYPSNEIRGKAIATALVQQCMFEIEVDNGMYYLKE